jgi:hypothetical protein
MSITTVSAGPVESAPQHPLRRRNFRLLFEARWIGTLAVPLCKMDPGAEMGASFAMFFLFREGKIAI